MKTRLDTGESIGSSHQLSSTEEGSLFLHSPAKILELMIPGACTAAVLNIRISDQKCAKASAKVNIVRR